MSRPLRSDISNLMIFLARLIIVIRNELTHLWQVLLTISRRKTFAPQAALPRGASLWAPLQFSLRLVRSSTPVSFVFKTLLAKDPRIKVVIADSTYISVHEHDCPISAVSYFDFH